MRRRINWKLGDSSPISGHLVAAVTGDGTLKITTGFPVSAAEVSFSRAYQESGAGYSYGSSTDPEVFVSSMEDDGFTVTYYNIPDTLDINYLVM
jgi:hypothetical protein